MRDIDTVLSFRQDISPFLVHLTRNHPGISASDSLKKIMTDMALLPGSTLVSDARFGMFTNEMDEDEKREAFGAICFTETPISEIHCLLEISKRQVDLEPYGLVFLKENLIEKGVNPVWYLNNTNGDRDKLVKALCTLWDEEPGAAKRILPLLSVFGQKIKPPGAPKRPPGEVDFRWEREWRYPATNKKLTFEMGDIFIGICPYDQISDFEKKYPSIQFIDPKMNMKWFAEKLIQARKRHGDKYSVV